eukprot:12823273-Heterocapsa_arctica.AAC.1
MLDVLEQAHERAVVAGQPLRHLRRQPRDRHEDVRAAKTSSEEQLHEVAGSRGCVHARRVHGLRDEVLLQVWRSGGREA